MLFDFQHGGCSLVTNIADFWASRAVINYSTGLYDIESKIIHFKPEKSILLLFLFPC